MASEDISIADVLTKWDAGEPVWTIEMGGMGPGYEQAIQITAFEMLRLMVGDPPNFDAIDREAELLEHEPSAIPYGETEWHKYRDEMDKALFAEDGPCRGLGLSGAQYGAASNIASVFVRHGYRAGLDLAPTDRHILVSKNFPRAAKAAE